jgi:mannose-6-phosphate isomerase-like protein (cupin superfamily)
MQKKQIEFKSDFQVVAGNDRCQAAVMVIAPGKSEGGPDNRHRGSDQWLYVIGGEGVAIVDGKDHLLERGALILIERGEKHEIRNTGQQPLQTLNFYAPPAYTSEGDTLPSGESD